MTHDDQLRAELARTNAELLAVLSVAQTLRASRDLNTLYHAVLTQLNSIIKPDSLFIALYLAERDTVRFVYSMDEGIIDDEVNERSLDQSPLNARIIRGRRGIRIDDLDNDPVRRQQLVPFGNTARRSRSWMGAPMISDESALGVLAVQSYVPAAFSDADMDLLALLASQISVAVENARLFDQLRRTIVTLSTPLIPIAQDVLLLPLIGTVDAERAERLLEQTLDAIVVRQVDTLLLDVSGIASIDTFVVAQLAKLIKAATLLGARICLVGVSTILAQAIVAGDLALQDTQIFRDVQSALAAIALEPA